MAKEEEEKEMTKTHREIGEDRQKARKAKEAKKK